ncbi:Bax inhibitor-1/YccA family protein [Streptomyces sp. H27-D2]|uniref:Bax inhibitor-1/YccA family protein n=1 Tax=Streptomyces sp. H27-D2 TaxID=3046304 RepID=UPI002DBDFD20|nr:Bax inhibitor-1/YccA family protein [Streptomyces sp. H27-D2]MEC4017323.1 Bax inhibitor-1/YccA family protein [Streptomyces sp. H27-D2]
MRSSNPVFSRRGFSRDNGYAGFNAQQAGGPAAVQGGNPYAGAGPQAQGGNPYAQGANNPYAQGGQNLTPEQLRQTPGAPPQAARMTMDDVVMRTGMTLGTVIVGAILAWAVLPVSPTSYGIAIGAALIAMVLGLIQAFKRKPVPALILAYAAFEGVFLGALSEIFNERWNGIPMQAVLGTMAVFAAALIVYKTGLVRVNRRFYNIVMTAAIGFVLLTAVNLLFAVFGGGDGLGFRSGPLGIVFGVVGVVLGACFLLMDFKQVEDGIAYGAPREESWLAAFGLTLTLVWIYLELLRLIAILRGD